jgi:acyl carrier protein
VTANDLDSLVRQAITRVIPEADAEALDPAVPIRDQLDMDSMDFINFVAALDELTRVAVPEPDYGRLNSISSCVAYLDQQLARESREPPGKSPDTRQQ